MPGMLVFFTVLYLATQNKSHRLLQRRRRCACAQPFRRKIAHAPFWHLLAVRQSLIYRHAICYGVSLSDCACHMRQWQLNAWLIFSQILFLFFIYIFWFLVATATLCQSILTSLLLSKHLNVLVLCQWVVI